MEILQDSGNGSSVGDQKDGLSAYKSIAAFRHESKNLFIITSSSWVKRHCKQPVSILSRLKLWAVFFKSLYRIAEIVKLLRVVS